MIKIASARLPIGQILAILGFGGFLVFAAFAVFQRQRLWSPSLLSKPVLLRNFGELLGSACYVYAFVFGDLYTATALFQTLPLVITLGAAIFMGATVGWRRWSAIGIGFFGVMMIIRPGFEGVEPVSALALIAVIGFAIRDLSTRTMPATVSSLQLSAYGFASVGFLGIAMMVLWEPPRPAETADLAAVAAAICVGSAGYYAIVQAMRVGDIAVVAPFRNARLVFALVFAIFVFGENPDGWSLLGAAIIVGSGLYTLWREHRALTRSASATA